MKFNKKKFWSRVHTWIRSFIEIACAIITIITFSLYRPAWDYRYLIWEAKRSIKHRMKDSLREKSNKDET